MVMVEGYGRGSFESCLPEPRNMRCLTGQAEVNRESKIRRFGVLDIQKCEGQNQIDGWTTGEACGCHLARSRSEVRMCQELATVGRFVS